MPPLHSQRHTALRRLLSPHHHPPKRLPSRTTRTLTNTTTPSHSPSRIHPTPKPRPLPQVPLNPHRTLTTTPHPLKTISTPASPAPTPTPTPLPPQTYHTLSDTYIETLLSRLEDLSEANPEIDVEYSAGVLTLTVPARGVYVLNKQPVNRQLWLSSPVSGPKRFDWVGREGVEEGGDMGGEWVYLRDGSTLSGVLEEEVGVRV